MKSNHSTIYTFIFACLLLLPFGVATAQSDSTKMAELSVYITGAFPGIDYNLSQGGEQDSRYAGGIGIQYARYLNRNWSVSLGLEYQQYHSKAILESFNDSYSTTDIEGDDFEFIVAADSYHEELWIQMLSIPINLQYETNGTGMRFYASTGIKIGIPVISEYRSSVSGMNTSGYYEQWDVLLESPKLAGFGNWGDMSSKKQKLDIKNSYSLLFELGIKQKIKAKQNLYVGIYSDLGLNNINRGDNLSLSLIGYNVEDPEGFQYRTIFDAAPNASGECFGTRLKVREYGLKIRYAFDFHN